MATQLEREKEKRVEHLKQLAIRRIALKDLARGWVGWHELWSVKVRQRNLLKKAGAKLTKPKLVAAYAHWFKSWSADQASRAAMTVEQRLADEEQKRCVLSALALTLPNRPCPNPS